MTYAFSFDASFCSGCKACQAACKDKNNLPVGVLWRRVIEVSGGTWQKTGVAWDNTVFAYNLSMSCNHCVHPKCAGVCPVDAYDVRADGIVVLDSTKCIGCGYCAWACPYGAPQYNPQAGYMTKCDFCLDQLEQGLPPACVAACPMRVLGYGEAEIEQGIALWNVSPEEHPFPLPVFSHTQPRLTIQPHAAMTDTEEKILANLEEVQSRISSIWEEVPLMLFTLLGQLAVGGFWVMSWMFERGMASLSLVPQLIIGAALGAGMLSSFAHLGTKKNAWRVLNHLSRSWLSRELLFAGLFGLGWLGTILESATRNQVTFEAAVFTSILGIGLVYSMGQVYRLPAAPGWNTWRTNVGFMVSTLLLGLSFMDSLLSYESKIAGGILVALFVQLALISKRPSDDLYIKIRIGLILSGIGLTVLSIVRSCDIGLPVFLLVAAEEVLGRWLFYRSRT